MASLHLTEGAVQGFLTYTVTNDVISLTLIPELGGKLSSLRDLRSGREWLWSNERLPYRQHPYGASYIEEADTGGWDECFPTVAPCRYPLEPWRGTPLPDHGELWSQAWTTTVDEVRGGLELRSEARGVALPYTFSRSIHIGEASDMLRFDYRVESQADYDLVFIWSAHPLFAIEPGMQVRLPESARLQVYLEVAPTEIQKSANLFWPMTVANGERVYDLTSLPDRAAEVAFKVWSEPLDEGWASLEAQDGALRFNFDPKLVPQVGLWFNAGSWSGAGGAPYYNLALEPCIGAQDALTEAVERYDQYALLPPGGARSWWLETQLALGRP